MKRLFSALLCLALIAGSAACSDDETTRPVLVVNAGESFLSLDALARAGKISVTSSLPWRVTAAAGTSGLRSPPRKARRDIPRSR